MSHRPVGFRPVWETGPTEDVCGLQGPFPEQAVAPLDKSVFTEFANAGIFGKW